MRDAFRSVLKGLRVPYPRGKLTQRGVAFPDAFAAQKELIHSEVPIIFDVGAHVGSTTKLYRRAFPKAHIFSFEPFPGSYRQLAAAMMQDGGVECVEVALTARRGSATLCANASAATNSLLEADRRASLYWGEGLLEARERVSVTTTTIDDFVADRNLPKIDILKLDVQGAEYAVLEGASVTLGAGRIEVVYLEILLCPTYAGQRSLADYLRLFETYGFGLIDFFDQVRSRGRLIQVDGLFALWH